MTDRPPLLERKRRQARERIVRAAEELFDERGFDAVSITEIADRADVGRTTFFRHFGDKQSVVFAQEEELMATIAEAHGHTAAPIPLTPAEAVAQLRDIVVALCAQAAQDPAGYTRHYELIAQHTELQARDALKMQQFGRSLAEILTSRGADDNTAQLAAQIALACHQAARTQHHNDPRTLADDAREAFDQVLSIGSPGNGTDSQPAAD